MFKILKRIRRLFSASDFLSNFSVSIAFNAARSACMLLRYNHQVIFYFFVKIYLIECRDVQKSKGASINYVISQEQGEGCPKRCITLLMDAPKAETLKNYVLVVKYKQIIVKETLACSLFINCSSFPHQHKLKLIVDVEQDLLTAYMKITALEI